LIANDASEDAVVESPWRARMKALLLPLPVLWLLLGHPALPSHALVRRAMPAGLEVLTAMLSGAALVVAFAARDARAATRAVFEGMGHAYTHIITIIAVSTGMAKALEVAGVFHAFVSMTAGSSTVALAVAFALAFGLSVVSGSGTASSVALITAIAPRAAELGVSTPALVGVVLFGAEAGRTASPVAAVLLLGSNLVSLPPRALAARLALPSLLGGAAGALVWAARA
jgi:C4-dicarboxylate transporter, DcuC family